MKKFFEHLAYSVMMAVAFAIAFVALGYLILSLYFIYWFF